MGESTGSTNEAAANVLFLCTGNSARSLLAEAVLARIGGPGFRAFSAGSRPKPSPHPMTLEVLEHLGYPTQDLRSKSWDEFAQATSPRMDLVVTVCDNAAGESCPIWPGAPLVLHWSIPDPAAFRGSRPETLAHFEAIHDQLLERIRAIVEVETQGLTQAQRREAWAASQRS